MGAVDEAKGRAKEAVGDLTGDKGLKKDRSTRAGAK